MKILVLSSHTISLFWFRMDMIKAFLAAGHEVVAAGQEPEAEWAERFFVQGVRYRQIFVERNGMNPLQDLKTFGSIYRLLKQERPDKIFAYQAKTVIYGCIAAKLCRIDGVYPLIAGLGSAFRANTFKSKLIKWIMTAEYYAALRGAKCVIFQNPDDLGEFVRHRIVAAEKTQIINGSGVDTARFCVTPMPEEPVFLMIARLIRDKGVLDYLDACRLVKEKRGNIRCLLVGPFDTNPSAITPAQLQTYIDDGTVEYFGEQADVAPFLAQCSVFVLPSYHEGTPKTVLEAMACGRAVITTDAPGCRETVRSGMNGILVEPGNVEDIAHVMLFLCGNPEEICRMGKCGREIAIEKYDVHKVNARIIEIMKLKGDAANVLV